MLTENLNVANQSIPESCPSSLIKLDADGIITQISPELSRLCGMEPDQLVGCSAQDASSTLRQLLEAKDTVEISAGDAGRYWFNHNLLVEPALPGEIHIFTNITTVLDLYNENQRLQEEARQLQLTDQDTSLLTKRALLLVLETQVARCRRYETSLSVMMLDLGLDNDTNDTKQKLLKVSRMLKDQLRWSDLIARSAPSQFTVILPETEYADAMKLINKISEITAEWGPDYTFSHALTEWKKGSSASDLLMNCEHDLGRQPDSASSGQVVA